MGRGRRPRVTLRPTVWLGLATCLAASEAVSKLWIDEEVSCRSRESGGISWLLLRKNLQELFRVNFTQRRALKEALFETLERLHARGLSEAVLQQLAMHPSACRVGRACLRLLLCTVRPIPCDAAWIEEDVLLAYGLSDESEMDFEAKLRSGWPTHMLVHMLVERAREELGPAASNQQARTLVDAVFKAELPQVALDIISNVTLFEVCSGLSTPPSCPYQAPLDSVFCAGLVTQISALARCLEVSRRSDQWILWMNDCRQAGDPALPQQRFWTPVKEGNIRWTPLPSKCIDGSAGGALELKDCVMDDTSSSASNQRFLMPPSLEGPLRWSPNSDMCLTMESVDGSGSVRLAPCDEGHRQRFRVPPGGQDVLCAGGLALSSSGAGAPLMARAAALSALALYSQETNDGQRGMELWNEVGQVLRAALVLEAQDGKLVMESLAMSPWPISELLSWAVQMKHQGQKPEMFEGALAHAVGMCACDMSLWSPMEARAVADAQRVLEEMNQLTSEDVDQLSEVALSAALCDSISWDSRLLAATTLLKEMVKDPQIQEEELHTETWDRICLPAVASLGLVCPTRELFRNRPSRAVEWSAFTLTLLTRLRSCIDPVSLQGRSPEDIQALRLAFFLKWPALSPWLPDPHRFLHQVQSPLVKDDRWWRASSEKATEWAGTSMYGKASQRITSASTQSVEKRPSAACLGVWDLTSEHPCHKMPGRSAGSSAGFPDETSPGVPQTRVLGVGLMKAGTTVVWHALGAALNMSMGMDCEALSQGEVPLLSIQRREAPLELVLQACHEDLFRWELSKDVLLTPLASRLAGAWPAFSRHGLALKLYFVVRHPLDFATSFLAHLGLDSHVAFAEQHFLWVPGRFPRHFTAGKQAYLDTAMNGLRYSGYVDAVIQRWALVVDEYLHHPQDFVLLRYEDFVSDPVGETRKLAEALGFSGPWDEEGVHAATQVQYQTSSTRQFRPPEQVFEPKMLARIIVAVEERMGLVGYKLPTYLQALPKNERPAIDMPPLVKRVRLGT